MENMYIYPAKLEKEEGYFQLTFPDFPEMCLIEEESLKEAVSAAQESLALTIFDYEARKVKLPRPSQEEENVIYIQIWLPYYRKLTKEVYVRKNVTIPEWLDTMAKEQKINYSAALVRGIKEELEIDD